MPTPIYTPRINNNDDEVRLAAVLVDIGSRIRAGDPVIDVETDKATFTVESTGDGYLIGVAGNVGDTLAVGSVLAWIGATADEKIAAERPAEAAGAENQSPTLKALLLLKQYGLREDEVPRAGGRLTAEEVQQYANSHRRGGPVSAEWSPPMVAGHIEPFTPEQKGMMRSVTWHREEAAAGYIELAYDPQPWERRATEFQKEHNLLMSPLLSLMAWRLARLAAEDSRINATASPHGAYLYGQVNLGFTVQAGRTLYMVVARDAAAMDAAAFVNELGELQRAAMRHSLRPEQAAGATIAFTSMSRWKVSRHIPILPPQTSLIVAHTAPNEGSAYLGATYDHRILTGFDVVQVLQSLSSGTW